MLKDDGKIVVNGKWQAQNRVIASLTPNQQDALASHERSLKEGRPVMERFNYIEGETAFFRGQPETEFTSLEPRNQHVRVILTGLGHWQLFVNNRQDKGTRYTENLQSTLLKVIEWDDDQLVVGGN